MAKKHSKHTKLTLRNGGEFAPNELSFVGVKCGVITDLIHKLSVLLHDKIKMGYVDASHNKELVALVLDVYTYHASSNTTISASVEKNKFNDRIRFSAYDLVCVNGNHFPASRQVVFLDPEKENSIAKRIEQLGDVQFFIRTEKNTAIFNCLLEVYPAYKNLPIYEIEDIETIAAAIQSQIEIPKLNGLVLVGGKSSRMGADKSQLAYHGMPQSEYAVQLLENQGLETFVSVRENQQIENKKTITDAFVGLGPFGAICSAFMKNPNEAYLVLATDLPYVSDELLALLLSKRNPKKIATAIKGKSAKFMEPLITIWEPKSYPILLNYLAQGYSCPRKILINSEVEIVEVEDALIRNVNTPSEFETVKKELKSLN